jgi:hypothetical protein
VLGVFKHIADIEKGLEIFSEGLIVNYSGFRLTEEGQPG